MLTRKIFRIVVAPALLLVAGCGALTGLPVVPDDCAFFSRAEARVWYAVALTEEGDGSSQIEAVAVIVQDCLENNCDGTTAGACAVSCAACADALVEIAYE
jgi:hypothetical protein